MTHKSSRITKKNKEMCNHHLILEIKKNMFNNDLLFLWNVQNVQNVPKSDPLTIYPHRHILNDNKSSIYVMKVFTTVHVFIHVKIKGYLSVLSDTFFFHTILMFLLKFPLPIDAMNIMKYPGELLSSINGI